MRIRSATEADAQAILGLWREGTSVVSHTLDHEHARAFWAEMGYARCRDGALH